MASAANSEITGVQVFWHPGCSACMNVKEKLTKYGVPWEGIDVDQPGGYELMKPLGVKRVPIVAKDGQWVSGESWRGVVEFLGLDVSTQPELNSQQMGERMNRILSAACDIVRAYPDDKLLDFLPAWAGSTMTKPDPEPGEDPIKPRTFGRLSYHLFMVADAFLISMGEGQLFTHHNLTRMMPNDTTSFSEILAVGEKVAQEMRDWTQSNSNVDFTRMIDTFYGRQTVIELFERCTWHCGQHARQLTRGLEALGIPLENPLTPADFQGLPMPTEIFT